MTWNFEELEEKLFLNAAGKEVVILFVFGDKKLAKDFSRIKKLVGTFTLEKSKRTEKLLMFMSQMKEAIIKYELKQKSYKLLIVSCEASAESSFYIW